ncbi:MAG: CHRD domain-containing protein [Chloroflexi bacterium]|nr:CHRD domain-containing protein [Chloroflexota bacterium]
MRRPLFLALMLALAIVGSGLLAADAAPATPSPSPDKIATATLTPAGEGLPGALPRGTATFKAFTNVRKLWFELRVEGLAPNSKHAWHIHQGTCATQGGIIVNPATQFAGAAKDLTANSAGVAYVVGMLNDRPTSGLSVLTNSLPYYVNVHQTGSIPGPFGGGITCGDLSTNPVTTDYTVSLTGAAEVNGAGTPNQGDPDGSGTALIKVGPTWVCAALKVKDITLPAANAHIHNAAAGANGPVVVNLPIPNAAGTSNGCTLGVSAGLTNLLKTAPANYYVNVHTSDFPAGALRGQLA